MQQKDQEKPANNNPAITTASIFVEAAKMGATLPYLEETIAKIRDFEPIAIERFRVGEALAGFLIYDDNLAGELSHQLRNRILGQMNLKQQTIEFLNSLSAEDIERLKRTAQINFHRREIDKLEKEISSQS